MTEDINDNKSSNKINLDNNVWYKSIRVTINLLINILMTITILVCVLFVWNTGISAYTLHIIFCVLGYQFFMCQGTLMMSKYNTWSVFMTRRHRKYVHIGFQVIGAGLAATGTYFIVNLMPRHFTSTHGLTGLLALIFCGLSLFNGLLVQHPWKLRSCIGMFWIKFFHYITGTASLFLATSSLVAAFKYNFFIQWLALDNAGTVLITITWLFTVLVSIEFWITSAKKICNMT